MWDQVLACRGTSCLPGLPPGDENKLLFLFNPSRKWQFYSTENGSRENQNLPLIVYHSQTSFDPNFSICKQKGHSQYKFLKEFFGPWPLSYNCKISYSMYSKELQHLNSLPYIKIRVCKVKEGRNIVAVKTGIQSQQNVPLI